MSDKSNDDMVFYIIMRTDLDSLNPGKAMAQSAHAGECMRHAVKEAAIQHGSHSWRTMYVSWLKQGGMFGDTIVLGAPLWGIEEAFLDDKTRSHDDVICGWVTDPEYPIRDGAVIHVLPMVTCAFMFGSRDDCARYVINLDWHE